eukprot:7756362-Pyramimonas_sp.AAC.1
MAARANCCWKVWCASCPGLGIDLVPTFRRRPGMRRSVLENSAFMAGQRASMYFHAVRVTEETERGGEERETRTLR